MKKRYLIILLSFFYVLLFNISPVISASYEADYVPWSGYWWPFTAGGLATGTGYRGTPSPLSKYDYAVADTYYGPARNYGFNYYYDKNALSWEGMCFCWAAASILEPEPVHNGIYNETVFYVGDKKGILTAAYHGVLYNSFSAATPTDFHAVLEEFIRNQKIPVIINLGFDEEIWNYPVYQYESEFRQNGDTRHYTTKITYAGNGVSPDYIGTFEASSTYYYYFKLGANGSITESGWEDESITNHPVTAYEPYGTVPQNPGLDYETVKEIVLAEDDRFENNDTIENAVSVSSGRYTLLAMDNDFFKISMKKGDQLDIRFDSGDDEDMIFRSYTPERLLIQETVGTSAQVVEADKTGDYFIEAVFADSDSDNDYRLYLQHVLPYNGIFPVNPAGFWVNGIVLLNPDNTDRSIITLIDKEGYPDICSQSEAIRHQVGILEYNFNMAPTGTGYVRVDSDFALSGLQCLTDGGSLMEGSNLISGDDAASEIYYPCFFRTNEWQTVFGLINTGLFTEEIVRTSYDGDGQIVATDTIELEPGEKITKNTLYFGILKTGAVSMGVSASSGRNCLAGYMEIKNSMYPATGSAVVPLLMNGGSRLVLPHAVSNSKWSTLAAVMNMDSESTEIHITAYDSMGNRTGMVSKLLNAKQNFVSEVSDILMQEQISLPC